MNPYEPEKLEDAREVGEVFNVLSLKEKPAINLERRASLRTKQTLRAARKLRRNLFKSVKVAENNEIEGA